MKKHDLTEHVLGWKNIKHYGRRVGYYTDGRHVCFLTKNQCRLSDEEKAEVIVFVRDELSLPVKYNPAHAKYWPEKVTHENTDDR